MAYKVALEQFFFDHVINPSHCHSVTYPQLHLTHPQLVPYNLSS